MVIVEAAAAEAAAADVAAAPAAKVAAAIGRLYSPTAIASLSPGRLYTRKPCRVMPASSYDPLLVDDEGQTMATTTAVRKHEKADRRD